MRIVEQGSESGEKILLVDDSPSIRTMLEDRLMEGGYLVYSAENGRQALTILDTLVPDLVITDVSMPEMDGFELCRCLKDHPHVRDVPVIILTAATEEKDVIEGLGLGASDYIRKPFSASELILRVKNILRNVQEKSRLQEIFARHTSPEVMRELLRRPDELMLEGELREVTVLFADIRGFTRMVAGSEPKQIVKELNLYLTIMSEGVIAEGGTLDKYLGDGIMAVFGAPLRHEDDPLRAVRAAVQIQTRIMLVNQKRTRSGAEPMWVGVGVTCGPAVVGHIGSPRRMDYTAIGDCVNVASRLQGVARAGQIIISDEVYQKIKDRVMVEPLEPVSVKGKPEPMQIYSVLV